MKMTPVNKLSGNFYMIIISLALVASIIFLQVYFMGNAIGGLAGGFVIAWFVWLFGSYQNKKASKKLLILYASGIIIQCIHFTEEYYTGFQQKFPLLISDYSWSDPQFVWFNGVWMMVFIASAFGIRQKISLAYLFAWFFVLIGEIGNGIFHPALSLYTGSYFPGLYTSFLHLANGIFLFRELRKLAFTTINQKL